MRKTIRIKGRSIGKGHPVYIVAEVSANHHQNFDLAVKIIEAAKDSGADAVKLQTYTPDTLTIDCDSSYFRIPGTIWSGKTLYSLYGEAYTPWEWQPKLKEVAEKLELDFFSTPFDSTAVDFLENMQIPAYKIASFEIVDIPLIKKIAHQKKPIIMSTGMATLAEIHEAVHTILQEGCKEIALLKCTSAYPAPFEEMNLKTIPHLAEAFHVPVGLSDHTLGTHIPIAAVTLGACIIEKHFTLSRTKPGPDSPFSLEPNEFKQMVQSVRDTEKAIGQVRYFQTKRESKSKVFRRSLFVINKMEKGEVFTAENVRSIRPGYGLEPKYIEIVFGKKAARQIERGTPLQWNLIGENI